MHERNSGRGEEEALARGHARSKQEATAQLTAKRYRP